MFLNQIDQLPQISAITLRGIILQLSPKRSTDKKRRLCNLRMDQHVHSCSWSPGSHARILGGTRQNPSNDVMVCSRDACWPLPERWLREPKTNTHHASRMACMWSRSFYFQWFRWTRITLHASRFTHHAYVESWLSANLKSKHLKSKKSSLCMVEFLSRLGQTLKIEN